MTLLPRIIRIIMVQQCFGHQKNLLQRQFAMSAIIFTIPLTLLSGLLSFLFSLPLAHYLAQRLWSYDYMSLYKCLYYYYCIITTCDLPQYFALIALLILKIKILKQDQHAGNRHIAVIVTAEVSTCQRWFQALSHQSGTLMITYTGNVWLPISIQVQ